MHDMAIHQNGEQPNPIQNAFIHNIFRHRFPFSFKYPNSAGVISSTQQCKPVSPSTTHSQVQAHQQKDSLTHIQELSYNCCFRGTVQCPPPHATTVQVSIAQNC